MTKEDVIKKAWGEYYEDYKKYIDKNGLLSDRFLTNKQCKTLNDDFLSIEIYSPDKGYYFYRPKSLQGIEDNNGWIRIESEDDLPKDKCVLLVYPEFDDQYTFLYNNDKESKETLIENHTHYQPIEKPKPPIF